VDDRSISLNDGEELQENNSTIEETQQAALPEFPEEAFTVLFKSYRDLVEPCTEAPAAYHWVTFLTMTGLLLGRKLSISHSLPLYPNFYSLLIGTTGLNRKSTALNFGRRELLKKIENDIVVVTGAFRRRAFMQNLRQKTTPGFFSIVMRCDPF
jgi:hypothetical protein